MDFGTGLHLNLLLGLSVLMLPILLLAAWALMGPGGDRRLGTLLLLGTMYPLGEVSQVFYAVPTWIRWHLSDAGFIFALTAVAVLSMMGSTPERAQLLGKASWAASFAFSIAVINELMTALLPKPTNGVGRLDPVDLCLYFVAFWITSTILNGGIKEEKAKIAAVQPPPARAARRREDRAAKKVSKRERH